MIIDGKKIANSIHNELLKYNLKDRSLALVFATNNNVIRKFMNIKSEFASSLDIQTNFYNVTELKDTKELIHFINSLNEDAIVIQLPLDAKFSSKKVLNAIPFDKDIDVLSNNRVTKFLNSDITDISDKKILIPPVAGAVFEILNYYNVDLKGKEVLIMGEGILVGMPCKELLSKTDANVESINKDTKPDEILNKTLNADIIITGVGKPNMVNPQMIKEGVVLIDAGSSTRSNNGALSGDIDLSCRAKASLFAKVPGGVGPVTIAKLFENLALITQ